VEWGSGVLFLRSCPYALILSDEIRTIWTAHRWFEKASFFQRYPNPPLGLIRAVEAWDLGRAHAEAEEWKRINKK
jgi:hypothetical protein